MADIHRWPGLTIVIPAYNERNRLPRTLNELERYRARFNGPFEVIVVDDGSVDDTAALVRCRANALPWLSVLPCPHRGKGAAVRSGMLAARHPWVVLCDADLSMPVDELDLFLAALDDGCQVAIGSRALPESRRYHQPLRRRLMSHVFSLLVRALVVPGIKDTQCGFKGFQRDVARELFSLGRLEGFGFDVEIIFLAHKYGYRLREVPITWYFDADSRVRAIADTVDMAVDLLRIRSRGTRGHYRRAAPPRMAAEDHALDLDIAAVERAVGN
jgi:dolichyl-phosphate beta-glucosyltransferase